MNVIRRTRAVAILAVGLLIRAPVAPAAGPLRIAFFTDVHTRAEWGTPEALALAADAINARKPDLVISGGDLITDGFESGEDLARARWDVYMEMHRRIEAPVHAAMGNHDLVAVSPADGSPPSSDPRAMFRERMGVERTYRSFDQAGCHFILLDTTDIVPDPKLKYRGWVGGEQLEWLKQDLAGLAPETPIVLVTHLPLLTAFFQATEGGTAAAGANRIVVNNTEVLGLFRNRNLVLVLQGHAHVNETIRWGETTFITGGAVCGQWWRGPWAGTEEGFGIVTLEGNRVEWEYVDYGWQARRPPGQ